MRRYLLLFVILSTMILTVDAQKVSVNSVNQPAATVFRSLIEQTGKNFVYSSELLKDMKVSVKAKNKPLKQVLSDIFAGTDIEYKIKGNNVILKRKAKKKATVKTKSRNMDPYKVELPPLSIKSTMLDEVGVLSRLEDPAVETSYIGAKKSHSK